MKSVFGGILLAVGLIVMTLSGLCSGVFITMMLAEGSLDSEMLSILLMPLVIGGVPFVIGLGLFVLGRVLLREGRAEQAATDADRRP